MASDTTSRARGSKRTSPRREGRSHDETGGTTGGPSLRFYHSEELRSETLALLARLDRAEDASEHAKELARLVARLTESGLDYFFMLPLREAHAGFMIERSAALGIGSAMRVMEPLLRGIVGRLSSDQLKLISGHIRRLMD